MKSILVLCTGNSARSILGEALLNHHGQGRFTAFSAGSQPKGHPHPGALDVLARNGMANEGYSSKSWDVFSGENAPHIDIVITVCDNAAGETCPAFPGKQTRSHWGIEDPADAQGADAIAAAFDKAFAEMSARVARFCKLDVENMDEAALQQAMNDIGIMEGATIGR